MTTLTERGRLAHARRLPAGAGQSVVFRRGDQEIAITGAILSPAVVEIKDAKGFPSQLHCVQAWIPKSQVVLDGTTEEPRMGDEIEKSDGTIFRPFRTDQNSPAVMDLDPWWLVNLKRWQEAE